MNITITNASTGSWLTVWPSNQAMPTGSTINFDASNWALANGAIIPLGTATNELAVSNAAGAVHLIIDVNAYYE